MNLRPTKLNDHPPVRKRYCQPCLTAWQSTESTCWLCGGEGTDGVLAKHYKAEEYDGVYKKIQESA